MGPTAGAFVSSTLRQALPPALPIALTEAHRYARTVPPMFLLVGHSLFSTTLAPDAKAFFLLHYWLTFLGGFAGGPLSALLIMDPSKAPISLFSSNRTAFTWTLIWWLMTYSPFARLLNAIFNLKPVKMTCKACVAYNRASLVVSRVLLAASLYPGVHMAPILIGTISICGGKTIFDALRHVYGLAQGPSEFTVPTYSFRSAFLGACMFYIACVCPLTSFLTPEEGAGGLITLFVAHSLLNDVGFKLDWSELLMGLLLQLANIPTPVGVPSPMKPSVAGSGGSAKQSIHGKSTAASGTPTSAGVDTIGGTAVSKAQQPQQQVVTKPSQAVELVDNIPVRVNAHATNQVQEQEAGTDASAGQPTEASAGTSQRKSRKKKVSGHQEDGWQVVGAAKRKSAAVAAAVSKKVV